MATEASYPELLARLRGNMPEAAAFEAAVGGDFLTVGKLEYALLRTLGLKNNDVVVDVGCGSGRLALQLSRDPEIKYVGLDILPELLQYAEKLCGRADWKFLRTNGVDIPVANDTAALVCFFSVFTHLPHQDIFRYLQEAVRIARPGGRVVFSFLEFAVTSHWTQFQLAINAPAKTQALVQFVSRDAIHAWAHHLGLQVNEIVDGDKPHIEIPEPVTWADGRVMTDLASFGQSFAVMTKPAAGSSRAVTTFTSNEKFCGPL